VPNGVNRPDARTVDFRHTERLDQRNPGADTAHDAPPAKLEDTSSHPSSEHHTIELCIVQVENRLTLRCPVEIFESPASSLLPCSTPLGCGASKRPVPCVDRALFFSTPAPVTPLPSLRTGPESGRVSAGFPCSRQPGRTVMSAIGGGDVRT
jgi:hypothetical protein